MKGEITLSELNVVDHPLVRHKIAIMRDKNTGPKEFRELADEVATLMAYEVTRDMPLEDVEIETPITKGKFKMISGKKMGVVPILRAGLGMLDGVLKLIPAARVGHIGLYREPETLEAVEYYCKLPTDVKERDLLVVDPMLATGNTAMEAIKFIKERNPRSIKLMVLVAAPEGIKKIQDAHPDIDIWTAALDEKLNDHAYIVPGLGDAGDRLYGTK
jgi:uracil phosphoribosyltransferase